jgi:hypothetical protein
MRRRSILALICFSILQLQDLSHAQTTSITLFEGWNLISVPVNPTNPSVPAALSSINGKYSAFYGFDGTSYQAYIPDSDSNTLTRIEAGKGYWSYMEEAGTLSVQGTPASQSVAIKEGWNLIGYPSTTSRPVLAALSSIAGKYEALYAFDVEANSYKSYIPGEQSDLTVLEAGRGYWLYSTANTTWTLPASNPNPNPSTPGTKVTLGPADFTISIQGYVPFYRHKRDGRDCLGIEPGKYQDKPAAAKATFSGTDGNYKVTLTMYKEADGESNYALYVNEEKKLEHSYPSLASKAEEKYEDFTWETPIAVKKGDIITMVVKSHSNKKVKESGSPGGFAWSRGRWAGLTFNPVQ